VGPVFATFDKVHPSHAGYIGKNATSHVEKNESTAAKDGEDRSGHEEEGEAVEENMRDVFVGET